MNFKNIHTIDNFLSRGLKIIINQTKLCKQKMFKLIHSLFSLAFSGPRSFKLDVAVSTEPSNNGALHSRSSSS